MEYLGFFNFAILMNPKIDKKSIKTGEDAGERDCC
jgi:hypothetical protein